MVPKRGELIERLFKDKQYERVVSVLQDEIHGMRFSDMSGLRELDSNQLTALSRLLNLTPREQVRSVFIAKNAPVYDAYVHNIVLAAIRFVDVLPPQEVYDMVMPAVVRVPERYQVSLLTTLSQNAESVGRPDLAANALVIACQAPSSTWKDAMHMVQCHRWSGKPGTASKELKQWIVGHRAKLSDAEMVEADDLNFQLALEAGQPGEAFEVCLRKLAGLSTEKPIPADLMATAMSVARQSGRNTELLPWLQKYVAAMPEAKMTLAALHGEAGKSSATAKEFLRWGKDLAQWSDWNSDYDTAFDFHLKLAALGDEESRERCVEIYDYLGRTEECCELLSVLGDIPEKPQYQLLQARLLAELGRDEESATLYKAWMAAHPTDRNARYDYACLLEDMGDEAASRKAFAAMLEQFPDDARAMVQLATACVRDSDLPQALTLYAKLPDGEHTPETLENYAMIAESLDDAAAEYRALRLGLALTEKPTVEMYVNLAEAAMHNGDAESSLRTLAEGLARLPQSSQLRIGLAEAQLQSGRAEDALATLLQDTLKNNFDAAEMLLAMAEQVADPTRVLAFLGGNVEQRFPLSAEDRLQLAVLHANAGHTGDVERLFASVPETPETLKLLADARHDTGHIAEAARLMTAYVDSHPHASAQEWVFLGELWEELGRTDEARKAFDRSLVLLTSDLPDTASN